MARAIIAGTELSTSNIGLAMSNLITTGDIALGSGPGYETCKNIYLYHPLGAKIAEKPIELAQSQMREIVIPGVGSAGDKCKEEFEKVWEEFGSNNIIFNGMSLSRVYGVAVIALIEIGKDSKKPIDYTKLRKENIVFNVYDPLNVAGSLVLDQNPLSPKFLHVTEVAVGGQAFHRSRTRVIMNENPVYLAYQNSGFGFTGRSVYQRALLPLKSFVQTMITDDMVSVKAGVIIAKIKQAGSVINQAMRRLFGGKRDVVKEAIVGNVISIGTEGEEIETLNMQNLEGPFKVARDNILNNIASAVPMPAKMLTDESFAGSLHEGTEDARAQARYIDRIREKMEPLYIWMDKIIQRLAWTPEFFETLKASEEFAEVLADMDYETFFWRASNSFKAKWPSLMKEPDSELVKVDKVKIEGIMSWVQEIMPHLPQEEKAKVLLWANDELNNLRLIFTSRLDLDYEAIAAHTPEPAGGFGEGGGKPFGAQDAVDRLSQSVTSYLEETENRRVRNMKRVA